MQRLLKYCLLYTDVMMSDVNMTAGSLTISNLTSDERDALKLLMMIMIRENRQPKNGVRAPAVTSSETIRTVLQFAMERPKSEQSMIVSCEFCSGRI